MPHHACRNKHMRTHALDTCARTTMRNEHYCVAQVRFETLFAEVGGLAVGFALFFHNYSTWEGVGVYLEVCGAKTYFNAPPPLRHKGWACVCAHARLPHVCVFGFGCTCVCVCVWQSVCEVQVSVCGCMCARVRVYMYVCVC